jgi:hypothetical protein
MNGEKEEEKKTRPTGPDGDVGCFLKGEELERREWGECCGGRGRGRGGGGRIEMFEGRLGGKGPIEIRIGL